MITETHFQHQPTPPTNNKCNGRRPPQRVGQVSVQNNSLKKNKSQEGGNLATNIELYFGGRGTAKASKCQKCLTPGQLLNSNKTAQRGKLTYLPEGVSRQLWRRRKSAAQVELDLESAVAASKSRIQSTVKRIGKVDTAKAVLELDCASVISSEWEMWNTVLSRIVKQLHKVSSTASITLERARLRISDMLTLSSRMLTLHRMVLANSEAKRELREPEYVFRDLFEKFESDHRQSQCSNEIDSPGEGESLFITQRDDQANDVAEIHNENRCDLSQCFNQHASPSINQYPSSHVIHPGSSAHVSDPDSATHQVVPGSSGHVNGQDSSTQSINQQQLQHSLKNDESSHSFKQRQTSHSFKQRQTSDSFKQRQSSQSFKQRQTSRSLKPSEPSDSPHIKQEKNVTQCGEFAPHSSSYSDNSNLDVQANMIQSANREYLSCLAGVKYSVDAISANVDKIVNEAKIDLERPKFVQEIEAEIKNTKPGKIEQFQSAIWELMKAIDKENENEEYQEALVHLSHAKRALPKTGLFSD